MSVKKAFEEIITDVLKGDTQKNALNFAAFLNENEMVTGGEHGQVSYKGTSIAYIHIDGKSEKPGPWTIWPDGDFSSVPNGFVFDEPMKEIAWKNVNTCANCGCESAPGSRKTIFGKEFDNVCNAVMAFTDPTSETLECVKKLLEMCKNANKSSV
ncbi:MAG: hypothetical protein FWE27_00435 [Defluviitaleaceae bacterium]|nr:hypothetical protein [Defluviitaleaceae bacterium]